jgi:hypothetical protein
MSIRESKWKQITKKFLKQMRQFAKIKLSFQLCQLAWSYLPTRQDYTVTLQSVTVFIHGHP